MNKKKVKGQEVRTELWLFLVVFYVAVCFFAAYAGSLLWGIFAFGGLIATVITFWWDRRKKPSKEMIKCQDTVLVVAEK